MQLLFFKQALVLTRVNTIITSVTGVSAANALTLDVSTNSDVSEIISEEVALNTRGWIVGTDNRRINIYSDSDAILSINGVEIDESSETIYNNSGDVVGNVWSLGDTGRKLYALYNGDYELTTSGDVKIEYMNNGYFDKVIEYTNTNSSTSFFIDDFSTMNTEYEFNNPLQDRMGENQLAHVYTADELSALNQD